MRKYIIGGIIGVLLVGGLISLFVFNQQEAIAGVSVGNATDLIGSKVGTTTTGTAFGIVASGGRGATTTYPFFIGGGAKDVMLTFQATKASTTADITFELLASNDASCNTATTSADVGNPVLMSQINWFDAGPFIQNSTALTSLDNSTTTIRWANPSPKVGSTLNLINVNANCLAVRLSASSTEVWAQYKVRSEN